VLFRLSGDSLLFLQQKRSKQESAAPAHKLLFLKSKNKSAFFTPDFCGCCGTHES
jgi:hypothetical protein